jgi:hypothetical protein
MGRDPLQVNLIKKAVMSHTTGLDENIFEIRL